MERKFVTVTEFCTVIKRIFSAEEMLHNIAIIGEISGYSQRGAHAYFKLKDEGSALDCSCFNYKKTYIPKEGEKVILVGSPDFYVPYGKFSFVVNSIEPQGVGLLFQRIEELKKKLTAEGIFDVAHKIPIPKYCKNIIVVTSKEGAVIRDICRTVRKYNDTIDIVVKDVKVQGEYAARDIVRALVAVDKLGYDCCILARGGGSLEDLMPFYDEQVVHAVYNMNTPIISAIGHETDFSLCDFAADLRCATPTAAAEQIAYDCEEIRKNITDNLNRIKNGTLNLLSAYFNKTKYLATSVGGGMDKLYRDDMNRLRLADTRMLSAVSALQQKNEYAVDKAITTLDKFNPTRILKSGYFRVYSDNLPITSVESVKIGDDITVKGADGEIAASVTAVKKEEV